ncbi:NUDIX hydrolase [Halomarina oriensis]|uniref:NUDIX domain-containing protein n=1 Tax=Halomarina oriensis TaxID=671145 RepID=A0A6B0GI63_9EURY|nr:NUDIX hydrolase [Halomarina oriensis]MWG34310.1 NUDIX domain-containing protein [Halomarina oriensis]
MDEEAPGEPGGVGDWVVESSRSLGVGGTTVGYDRLTRPDGERAGAGWVEHRASVAIVARHEGDVLFVEEYRPRLRETVLTCPVGSAEREESLAAAGRRELREETGYEAEHVEVLAEHYPVAWLRSTRGAVFADGLRRVGQDLDDSEFVDVHRVPVEEALDRALNGEGPRTAWTLLPLLLAREGDLL